MKKSKMIYQSLACLVIAAVYITAGCASGSVLEEKRASAVAQVSKHYTVSDIADFGKRAVSGVIKAPAAVTGYIISSQDQQKYGLPLDEPENGETGAVYAAAGGRVIKSGENDVLGKYVVIDHDDKVSTYGNCDRIYVKAHEHVRKGQVIASFTNDGNKNFLYDLKDK